MRAMGLAALALFAIVSPRADLSFAAPPQGAKEDVIAIKAGKIYTVSGDVIAPGIIVIKDGRIIDVRKGTDVPDGARVIDASSQVVIPGLIDASATIDGGADSERTIAPEVQAIDGYDFFADQRRELSGGITTACVTPGSRRLLSGQGAIVKTAGDREKRVLRKSHGLRLTLGDAPKNPPGILKAPLPASSDKPILPVERQYPASRMGQYAALRKAFAAAKGKKGAEFDPLLDAAGGRRPLFVVAHTCDDIVKAVLFADEISAKLVLVDAEEAAKAVDLLAERKIPVILTMPKRAEFAEVAEGVQDASTAATLLKAGVAVALHAGDDDARDLLLLAAYAVRNGLEPSQALRAITLSAAEILDVNERVGSIEKGKDADLVFLDADPLSGTASTQRVMIDGTMVFERRDSDSRTYSALSADASPKKIVAIKGGRVLTVAHGIVTDGLILVEGAKILYVGRMREIPADAEVIDATGLTITPGMIDAHTAIGLHAVQNEVADRMHRPTGGIPANIVNPASDYLRLDDPLFAEAAQAGITAALVAPDQGGVCSLVKLGPKAEVIRPVAAVKFAVGGGTGGYTQAKQFMERARKYHDEWEAFERQPKETTPPKPAEGTPAQTPDPITGTWKGTIEVEGMGRPQEFVAELKLTGKDVTGTISSGAGGRADPLTGKYDNGELRVEQEQQGAKITMVLKVASDAMSGTLEIAVQGRTLKGKVEAKRVAGGGATAEAPKAVGPRKDEQLDPWRKVFRREIPVLVIARDVPSIENATKLFRVDFDIDIVLLGADQADYLANTTANRGVSIAVGPDFLREERGATTNLAEALASCGMPVAFTTWTSGTRDLPLSVVRAVRYGFDPDDALKSVTLSPARMLKIDSRLGALERGRDADFVFYTGDPLNLTSQVRRVIISGKTIFERK